MLINNKIHRLPIIDPESGNIMSILNQKPLLKFLYNIPKVRTLTHLKMSIEEAGLGSYENIAVSCRNILITRFERQSIFRLPKRRQKSLRPSIDL